MLLSLSQAAKETGKSNNPDFFLGKFWLLSLISAGADLPGGWLKLSTRQRKSAGAMLCPSPGAMDTIPRTPPPPPGHESDSSPLSTPLLTH